MTGLPSAWSFLINSTSTFAPGMVFLSQSIVASAVFSISTWSDGSWAGAGAVGVACGACGCFLAACPAASKNAPRVAMRTIICRMMNWRIPYAGFVPRRRHRVAAQIYPCGCYPAFPACILRSQPTPENFRMHKAERILVAITFVFLMGTPLVFAQPASRAPAKAAASPMDGVITTLFGAKTFDQAANSPDGKQVAWVEMTKSGPAIFVSAAGGGTPRRITAGGQSESAVAWSGDSKQLAFLSDAATPGQAQVYTVNLAGGPARKLTSVKGFLAAPGGS